MFLRIMQRVCAQLGLRLANQYGMVTQIDPTADVVLLPHSLLQAAPAAPAVPFRAIRVVRDPRDIWLSSYLYHLRTREEWCTNTDFDPSPPIGYPRVDYSFAHRPEAWKQHWLGRLGGRSYQANLHALNRDDGLLFELDGYTACTLAAMQEWWLAGPELLQIKLEDIMQDFDGQIRLIFRHLGFDATEREAAVGLAGEQDIRRMSDAVVAANEFIYSRQISKWRDLLSPAQVAMFQRRYGDLIRSLNYAPA